MPPGFAARVQGNLRAGPSSQVLIWERAGLVGALASVAIAGFVHLQLAGRETESAARAWLDMDGAVNGEAIPR